MLDHHLKSPSLRCYKYLKINCLMPLGKHNSITAKTIGLPLDVDSAQQVYVALCTVHASWTYLCPPFFFADSASVDLQ